MTDEQKLLAMAASTGLVGLALKDLLSKGKAAALGALDQVERGGSSLVFCVRISGTTTEILGSLDTQGQPPTFLVDLKLIGVDAGIPEGGPSSVH